MRMNFKSVIALLVAFSIVLGSSGAMMKDQVLAQAGRKTGEKQKKNPNASGDPEEQQKQKDKQEEKKVDKTLPTASIAIDTNVVNVEAVVYNKKTGGVLQGLKKENFEIYEDGVKQDIENFSTPEAPVTMVLQSS